MNDSQHPRSSILVVDGDGIHIRLLQECFEAEDHHYHTTFVTSLHEARQALASTPPDLVLAALKLPDGRGTELIPTPGKRVPYAVVIMNSQGSENTAVKVMKAGALDYVVKTAEVLSDMPRIAERSLRQWRLLKEHQELEEQLRQSQKMESVGQLAGGVAHDFNNLLTAIIGYADMTLMDLEDRESITENLHQIRRAGERASRLTSQLLAFARKQILAPSVVSLNELILNLERMLRRLIGTDIELAILPEDNIWHVKADPSLLEQVIVNLVVNARHAMPDGGTLTLETANLKIPNEEAQTHAEFKAGEYVRLAIRDTGAGMSDEVKRRAFEPFFTTKEQGKGTGLGLAMAYGIVKQTEGHIALESELGRGTTISIYLPRTHEAPNGCSAPGNEAPPRGNETILLVEDEAAVRSFMIKALHQLGYTILEASNGPEALRLVKNHPEAIQLLLTDMVMPHMSGKTVAEEIRILRPEIRILYTSGYTDESIVRQGVLNETIHFLQKPYTSHVLAHKVRSVLDAEVK